MISGLYKKVQSSCRIKSPFPPLLFLAAAEPQRLKFSISCCIKAFNVSIDGSIFPFTNTTLTWTRNAQDPSGFWLNENEASDPANSKVLSMQVPGTSNSQGSLPFVFIRPGAFVIVAAADGQDGSETDFFTSPPFTVLAGTSTGLTSCGPTTSLSASTATVTTSARATVTATATQNNTSVIVGATIGTAVGVAIISALTTIFLCRRRVNLCVRKQRRSNTVTPFFEPSTLARRTEKFKNGAEQNSLYPQTKRSPKPPSPYLTASRKAARSHGSVTNAPSLSTVLEPGNTEASNSTGHMSFETPPLTERQRLLDEEAGRLRLQILGLVNHALSASTPESPPPGNDVRTENRMMAAEIERMRGQIEMLERQQHSDWARGLTNEPPSYLASIGISLQP